MDNFRVDDCNVQIHSDGSRATVFRVATGYFGRGYVSLDAVPGNDWRDAFFRSRQAALQMIEWMRRQTGSSLTAENARLQAAIRELIKTLRINCPHGNAVADCYDIPTYTGEE